MSEQYMGVLLIINKGTQGDTILAEVKEGVGGAVTRKTRNEPEWAGAYPQVGGRVVRRRIAVASRDSTVATPARERHRTTR